MPGEVTIDFGIDLGTTNSSIAIFHEGSPQIIKSAATNVDVTPSVVAISGQREWVGAVAKSQLAIHPDSTFFEFKRYIGLSHSWPLPDGGRVTPEELSARILKSLLHDASALTNADVTASVITVPAAFDTAQIAATRAAGELAGLTHVEALQEPIAAALAYGFDEAGDSAFLVFDFGGGTFDAALLQSRGGVISVVEHRGDNDLGAGKWDSAIVHQVIVPKLTEMGHEVSDFHDQGSKQFKLVKTHAEVARIELSRQPTALIDLQGILDARGEELPEQIDISVVELEALIEPSLRRATDLCHDLLREAGVSASSVSKMILVGGPTRTPALRRAVEGLGIELASMVDPMTVVARGAAIYAASKTRPVVAERGPLESAVFQLIYDAMVETEKDEVTVGLRLERAPKTDVGEVRVAAVDGSWESGGIALQDGRAIVSVRLVTPGVSAFRVTAASVDGTPISVHPETFSVTRQVAAAAAPLNHSIGVGVDESLGGTYDRIIERGSTMPVFERKTYRTTRPLGAGTAPIRLLFLEGESRVAERNLRVGEIVVDAEKITRPLPAASEVEIVVRWEEGQDPHASAYIPFLDQQFSEVLELQRKLPPDLTHLERQVAELRQRIDEGGSSSEEQAQLLQDIGARLSDARHGDAASAASAAAQVGPLLDKAEAGASAGLRTAATTRMEAMIAELNPVVDQYGSPEDRQVMATLISEARGATQTGSHRDVEDKTEKIEDHYFRVVMKQPGFWIEMFHEYSGRASETSDPVRAGALIQQGQASLDRHDIEGLAAVVRDLWSLFPESATSVPSFGIRPAN